MPVFEHLTQSCNRENWSGLTGQEATLKSIKQTELCGKPPIAHIA